MALKQRYGWLPDLPDFRDHLFAAPEGIAVPAKVDLTHLAPAPFDQGQLGSCTANGIAAVHIAAQKIEKVKSPMIPSRLFIYYNERVIEGNVSSDSGAQVRDGMKALNNQGVCSEYRWAYDITKFAVKPPVSDYKVALDHTLVSYKSIAGLSQMKACLASGYPFVFGFTVYDSFESDAVAATGVVPLPAASESVLGGHCISCFGYDDSKQWFKCLNSWGSSWGDRGFCYMPYSYLGDTNLADDFWQLSNVKTI